MSTDTTTSTPNTDRLAAARDRWVAAGTAGRPFFVERASGARIWDVDGREFIDFVGGVGTANHGHTNPEIVAAIRAQLDQYLHQCFSLSAYEPYVDVCRLLGECHPGDFDKKAILLNSGAEAVENAVKIARYSTGRDAIVCLDNAFHGRTLLTMSLTAKVRPYKLGFGPFAPRSIAPRAPTRTAASRRTTRSTACIGCSRTRSTRPMWPRSSSNPCRVRAASCRCPTTTRPVSPRSRPSTACS